MSCDPQFANVVLLLDCDGTAGSTSFPDLSDSANVVSAVGTAQVDTADPKFGTGNLQLAGGTTPWLSMPLTGDLDLSNGDFTVELWMNAATIGAARLLIGCRNGANSNGYTVSVDGSGQTIAAQLYGTSGGSVGGSISFSTDEWHHVALVLNGTTLTVYFDGVAIDAVGSVTNTDAFTETVLLIGADHFSFITGSAWNGGIDEIRITKGVARYTSNFTPPTEAFGVACPTTTLVPDVIGDDESLATAEIEYVGLVVGTVTTASSETVAEGLVISSDPVADTEVEVGSAVDLVISTGPSVCSGIPFTSYIAWPYLDFGQLGIDKMLEGFNIVCDGEVTIQVGYDQGDTTLVTSPYTVDGDTLPSNMVPLPVVGRSFQLRLTFSANQAWEWQAAGLYLSDWTLPA